MVKYAITILVALSFANQVHADILQFGGFEQGTLSAANGSSGTVAISTTTVKHGDFSIRSSPVTTATGFVEFRKAADTGSTNADFSSAYATSSFWFRVATLPTNGKEYITTASAVSSNVIYVLFINPDGTLTLRGNAVTSFLATSSTALATNQWYHLSIGATINTTGFYQLKINDVSEFTGTGNFGAASTYRFVRYGKSTNTTGDSVDFFYDTMVISNGTTSESFMNDETRVLMPDSDGTYSEWTTGSGAADWTQVDERIPDSTATIVTSNSTSSAIETYNASSTANAGVTGTVKAGKTQVVAQEAASTAGTVFQTLTRSGSVNATTTDQTALANVYVHQEQLFATSTQTGAAWTLAELDDIQIGMVSVNASTTTFRVTQASFEVLFTPGGATPTVTRLLDDFLWFE